MEKWNYNRPINSFYGSQRDWNQTLMTKLNQLSVGVKTLIVVKTPQKLKHLIESLEFYNNSMIGHRYLVEFNDSKEDVIEVGDFKLKIEF